MNNKKIIDDINKQYHSSLKYSSAKMAIDFIRFLFFFLGIAFGYLLGHYIP